MSNRRPGPAARRALIAYQRTCALIAREAEILLEGAVFGLPAAGISPARYALADRRLAELSPETRKAILGGIAQADSEAAAELLRGTR